MDTSELEYRYRETKERYEHEMYDSLEKLRQEYLGQFDFKEGDPIEYDGDFLGYFDSMDWTWEEEGIIVYYTDEGLTYDSLTQMEGIDLDRISLHEAA